MDDVDENNLGPVAECDPKPFRELGNLSPQVDDMDKKSKRSSNSDSGCESLPSDEKEFGMSKDRKENIEMDSDPRNKVQPEDKSDLCKCKTESEQNQLMEQHESQPKNDIVKPEVTSSNAQPMEKLGDHVELKNISDELKFDPNTSQPMELHTSLLKNDSNSTDPSHKPEEPKTPIDDITEHDSSVNVLKAEPIEQPSLKQSNKIVTSTRECRLRIQRCDEMIVKQKKPENDGKKEEVETSGRQTPEVKRKVATKRPGSEPYICRYCKQTVDDDFPRVIFPEGALEETNAMLHESLVYKEENNIDDRPTLLLTDYSIYCKEHHLCPIDTGIIESNGVIYACGYLKGFGPMGQWFIIGYDKEDEAELAVSTEYCIGLLDDPSDHYAPTMQSLHRKMFLSKQMVQYILEHINEDPQYEEMLEYLEHVILMILSIFN
ncbi:DNA (cytosine-5)-methyltransferase 1-like [Ephemera danica]|nr:DNA (cytosine-5)-methyltransferase 1-like [Ephemera danica]